MIKADSDEQLSIAVPAAEGPVAGSGGCKACGCRGYRQNYPKNDYCKDCGHSWYMHASVG
jgi:hypothetical protein